MQALRFACCISSGNPQWVTSGLSLPVGWVKNGLPLWRKHQEGWEDGLRTEKCGAVISGSAPELG